MAQLILNGKGPHEDPDNDQYLDFDSGDAALLDEIVRLLSQKRRGDGKQIDQKLAALCAASVEKVKAAEKRKASLNNWLNRIKSAFSSGKKNLYAGYQGGITS